MANLELKQATEHADDIFEQSSIILKQRESEAMKLDISISLKLRLHIEVGRVKHRYWDMLITRCLENAISLGLKRTINL